MKKPSIACLSALLAVLLLLSACGNAAPAPEEESTPSPEEEIETVIELPPSLIGTWVSLNNPEDILVFSEDAKLNVNGTEIEIVGITENGVECRCGDADAVISVLPGVLGCGYPLPLSERSSYAYFYKMGEENPADRFVGTWTLCSGEGSVRNGSVVDEFTITDDGELLLDGESYPTSFHMLISDQKEYGWMLQADEDRIWCSFYDDDPEALALGTGDGWGKYYQNIKTAELSLDTWGDFFDVIICYSFGRDDEGEIHNAMARLFLAQKEGIDILRVKDGTATVTSSPKAYAMIQYDQETGEYDFREIAPKERAKYNYKYFLNYKNHVTNDVFKFYGDGTLSDAETDSVRGWGFCALVYSEKTLIRSENIITSPTITDFYVVVNKVAGTVYYRDND